MLLAAGLAGRYTQQRVHYEFNPVDKYLPYALMVHPPCNTQV